MNILITCAGGPAAIGVIKSLKSMKSDEIQGKSMGTNESQCKQMKISEKTIGKKGFHWFPFFFH